MHYGTIFLAYFLVIFLLICTVFNYIGEKNEIRFK